MRLFLFVMAMVSMLWSMESGKIAFVKGEVTVVRENKLIPAKAGESILIGDVIKTGEDGRAKLMFKDNTVITIGKSSVFKNENYVYDEKNGQYDVKFKVAEGFFKSVTGAIGKVAKEKFQLKTRTATMGIRGTIFGGEVTEENENIYCLKGSISVESAGVTKIVEKGMMTSIKMGGKPSEPKKISPADHLKFNKETSTFSYGQCKVK